MSLRGWGIGLAAMLGTAGCASTPPVTYPQPTQGTPVAEPGPPPALPPGSSVLAEQGPYLPDAYLTICAGHVSNAPPRAADGTVQYSPLIVVNNQVVLATVPTNNACLSSGFGRRYGQPHEGIDLKSRPPTMVFSGGPGIIRRVASDNGYGLNVVIDHGSGVSTRYAHLSRVEPGIVEGAAIGFGQALGMMGQSGNATAIHVHYEVLVGQWGARGVWDLTPTNPFAWPAYDPGASVG